MRIAAPVLALALGLLASPVSAQPTPAQDGVRWSGWRVYWENDTYASEQSTTDRHYTNGVRFALRRAPDLTWSLAHRTYDVCPTLLCPGKLLAERAEVVATLVVGQNMFTPHLITTFEPDPDDRPFAGHLYGGLHTTIGGEWATEKLWSRVSVIPESTIEMDLGVLGAPSLAGSAQAAIHVLRENRIPKGWYTQIGPEPTAQLVYTNRIGLRLHPLAHPYIPQLEVTPSITGALGTVQIFAAPGVTFRAGWNLTGLATNIMPVTFADEPPPSWGFSLNLGWERRWWGRNAFIDGGILGEPPSATKRPHTTDFRWGGELRLDPFTLTYTDVERTQELASGPLTDTDHRFGSLALAYTAGTSNPIGRLIALGMEHLLLDAGVGMGASSDGVRTRGGRAMRVAAGADLGRWGLSWEMSGVVDEARAPGPDGSHTDLFFITKGYSVWVAPLERLVIGRPLLRVGLGKPLLKRQTLLGERIDDEVIEDGWRPLLGAGLEIPLTSSGQMKLGVETTWSPVSLTTLGRDGPQGEFLTTLVGFKWRPSFPAAHHPTRPGG